MTNSSSEDVFETLELIAQANEPLTLGAIAREKKIPLSSAFRIVSTLQNAGFIQASTKDKGYVIGQASHQLAQALFNRFKIRRIAYPFLQQLALMTGETCCLSVPIGWYCVRILSVRGTNEVVLSPPTGEALPLDATLAGQMLLAHQNPKALSAYRQWASRNFGVKIGKALLSELGAAAARGYAIEMSEDRATKRAVAFPVLLKEQCIASISIEGPVLDLRPAKASGLDRWLEVCAQINSLVQQKPELFRNPFAHIEPESIVLHPLQLSPR